ncbi:MAG TPA: helix-turn-helix transcriptional regulator [Candidatus Limnocylindria bacterium]|jgi:transcriptional regulator with XRE-family HTH domain|nr:helix-turn-helix transcriptional regulator [Candidatus Limnocylindria bacterium]
MKLAPDDGCVDDQRVGRIIRALRRRLDWRQSDLAERARCSQSMVSLVERGHLAHVSLPLLRRIFAALDASLVIEVRWRAGALERLLDEDHAALVAHVAALLRLAGWEVLIEATYSEWGERGSYDVLAFHPPTGSVLVVEIKTDLPSVEATLRKLDEKVRLAPKIGRERFRRQTGSISRLLVMPNTRTLRRRTERHEAVLSAALPERNVAVRRWIAHPHGAIAGLLS